MAEFKRLECRNHGNCLWILEYMTSCDGHLPEWDGERHDCAEYEPMPDAEALEALADELEGEGLDGWASGPVNVGEYARRIREACGEVDG